MIGAAPKEKDRIMNRKSIWAVVAGVLFIIVVTTLVDVFLHGKTVPQWCVQATKRRGVSPSAGASAIGLPGGLGPSVVGALR